MTLRRREFITLLGGAAAWPVAAPAQQRLVPVIGVLSRISAAAAEANLVGFRKGLSETGFFEGQNVAIEYRWGNSGAERLPELAADLVRRRVSVFYTIGEVGANAVKNLTTTIPVVFLTVISAKTCECNLSRTQRQHGGCGGAGLDFRGIMSAPGHAASSNTAVSECLQASQ
jgi:ABC-type uncharacterized transport system substrate-binding protein